jgi:hypothetical protein
MDSMKLTSRFLSDFEMRDSLLEGASHDYAVLFDDPSFRGKDIFCRTERCPYIVHLSDCTLYPGRTLRVPREVLATPAPPPFDRRGGHLIVTRDGRVTCGSVMRDSCLPGDTRILEDGTWDLPLPDAVDQIDEPVVFAELLCAHFGHALIDTPARLWYRLEPSLESIRRHRLVAFGTHGLGREAGLRTPSEWPGYLTAILGAIGVDPQDILLLRRPTRIRSLLIPKRLSPYGSNYGYSRRYLDVMTAAGDILTPAGASGRPPWVAGGRLSSLLSRLGLREREAGTAGQGPMRTAPMVYLSRSKLDPSQRGLSEGQERLIEDIFRRYGFEIVHPQLLSLAEQIRTVRRASHVAGCVGSQMHLLAFSRNMGKHVLRLAPSYFDPGFDRDILEMGGGSYTGFVVERASPERSERSTLPWRLTPDELSGLRQKVEDWLSATATRG